MSKHMIYLLGMLVYCCVMVGIGVVAKRQIKTSKDFQGAQHSIPPFVLAMTLIASWLGSGTMVGFASRVYYFGLGGIWYAVACVFSVVYFRALIGRIRQVPAMTTPEMLALRYGDKARDWSVIPVFLGQATIAAYQIKAVGYIFEITLGMSPDMGLVVGTVIILAYTFLGGFYAVAWTDVFQSCLFLCGTLVATIVAVTKVGGLNILFSSLPEGYLSVSNVDALSALGVFVPAALLGGTSMFMYQRAWAAKTVAAAKKSANINIFGASFVYTLVLILSLVAVITLPGIRGDVVIFAVADNLPVVVGMVLLVSALAIFMSTGASLLIASSTVFVREVYMRNKEPNEKKEIMASRITILCIGIIGMALLRFYPSLISLALLAYSIEGAGLLCPLVVGMYWKRGNLAGAIASIACGFTIVVGWEILNRLGIEFAQKIHSSLIAVPVAAIAYFLFSTLTENKDKERVEKFFDNFKAEAK
ncbi:MAG: sodium:solute symporter family protein [bacterium]|nr:sodium:solute symporter family protein [bacterium]